MKPMTEQEARAALKAEMPWATDIGAFDAMGDQSALVFASTRCLSVNVESRAPTLRAAVAKAIKAWRATQKHPLQYPLAVSPSGRMLNGKKKGAKR